MSDEVLAGSLYVYQATVLDIVDGDTIDVRIDLGCFVGLVRRIRLNRINAPELHAANPAPGAKSREYVVTVLPVGTNVVLRTKLDHSEKYGRLLAEVYYLQDVGWINLNDAMVSLGLAVPFMD